MNNEAKKVQKVSVSKDYSGQRLDNFLLNYLDYVDYLDY